MKPVQEVPIQAIVIELERYQKAAEAPVTVETCIKVEAWSEQGLSDEQIANMLKLTLDEFKEKLENYAELRMAMSIGQASGIERVTNALLAKACKGDNNAMFFYLKNRSPDNWNDKQKTTDEGSKGTTAITVEFVSSESTDS